MTNEILKDEQLDEEQLENISGGWAAALIEALINALRKDK